MEALENRGVPSLEKLPLQGEPPRNRILSSAAGRTRESTIRQDRVRKAPLTILIAALLVAVTFGTYRPVLNHAFLRYDDHQYVTNNPRVTSGLTLTNAVWAFGTGYASNWHPVTWLSHMLDVQIFGLNAGGHHLINLLFHIANTLLLFLLLRRLTGGRWRSAFVAALFALHPLHVESVAWIAERKDMLSTFFLLLSLWEYGRYAAEVEAKELSGRFRGSRFLLSSSYRLSLLFFALGLMSKPMLVTLPFLLLLMDVWPLQRFRLSSANSELKVEGSSLTVAPNSPSAMRLAFTSLLLEKLSFFCLTIVSCVVTYQVQNKGHAVTYYFPLTHRLANAVVSYWGYLRKMVWPSDLARFYPHPGGASRSGALPDWEILVAAVMLIVITILATACLWRFAVEGQPVLESEERGGGRTAIHSAFGALARFPWFGFGWFWYLGTLVPVLGIVQVGGQATADRYTYIPLIGIFICLAWAAGELATGFRSPNNHMTGNVGVLGSGLGKSPSVGSILLESAGEGTGPKFLGLPTRTASLVLIGIFILGACGVLTRDQLKCWRDNLAVFQHALAVTENNAVAHTEVGIDLSDQGLSSEAMVHFQAALKADPTYADANYYLGIILWDMGKRDEAIERYRAGLRYKPWQGWAHNSLGEMYWSLGRQEEAMAEFMEAVRVKPELPEAHYNLGMAYLAHRRFAEAANEFTLALRLKPDYIDALTGLGRATSAGDGADNSYWVLGSRGICYYGRRVFSNSATVHSLCSASIRGNRVGAALAGNTILQIYNDYGQYPNVSPGALLAESSLPCSAWPTSNGWITFENLNVALQANTYYWLIMLVDDDSLPTDTQYNLWTAKGVGEPRCTGQKTAIDLPWECQCSSGGDHGGVMTYKLTAR